MSVLPADCAKIPMLLVSATLWRRDHLRAAGTHHGGEFVETAESLARQLAALDTASGVPLSG
ncbi:hypothetical protein [Paraburkholderia sp. SIMBA_030]|uniref:hypothetical protein n=1 Tax=Paraburkholderia sp. SIMBA_030 TaxID=3085773 RepID=UPI0039793F3E